MSTHNNLDSDELVFAAEEELPLLQDMRPWTVLVVDDDQFVHQVTSLVLKDFHFQNRRLELLGAFSGEEARRLMHEHDDIALVLLDVVMEDNDTGLKLARWIRDDLKNSFVRIILRTGQPGHAPENEVITRYDINDYKEKAELTTQKLFTAVTTALRSYSDIKSIERNRKGLEMVISASADLFRQQSLSRFASGVLTQLVAALRQSSDCIMLRASALAVAKMTNALKIIATTGTFEGLEGKEIDVLNDSETMGAIQEALATKQTIFRDRIYVGYFRTTRGSENIIYLCGDTPFGDLDRDLIRLFASNIAVAFDNLDLNHEIAETQKELLFTLGEVAETRSKETANHVRRVAEYSAMLGELAGLEPRRIEMLRQASPMHDLGKIGIPDNILFKPGKLTPEEFEIIKEHTSIGYSILSGTDRPLTREASIVALTHHEKWDGSGYPEGLSGMNIPMSGRITAIADVFDALACERVYKEAWAPERIIEYFHQERGKHFDPELTDLFLDNIDAFFQIRRRYPE